MVREPSGMILVMYAVMKTSRYPHLLPVAFTMALLGVITLGSTGCSNVMVTKDVEGEVRLGELQVFVDHDFETTYNAAKAGMGDYGLFQTKDDKKVVEAELNGRDRADNLVTVKIKEVARDRTSIKIRFGITGDVVQSQKLFTAIRDHL